MTSYSSISLLFGARVHPNHVLPKNCTPSKNAKKHCYFDSYSPLGDYNIVSTFFNSLSFPQFQFFVGYLTNLGKSTEINKIFEFFAIFIFC
jgi:hypothetical protein